jgi:hypothetical protein
MPEPRTRVEIEATRECIERERQIAKGQIAQFAARVGPDDPLKLEAERRWDRLTAALQAAPAA